MQKLGGNDICNKVVANKEMHASMYEQEITTPFAFSLIFNLFPQSLT